MLFSYNWLKEYVPKLPSPASTAEALTMHAFEVESVEKRGKDYALDVKILSNRIADASGHAGMARELSAILNIPFKPGKSFAFKESAMLARNAAKVEVKSPLCSRYAARVLSGVSVGESPLWMQERLRACGLRPINNLVDVTNYVMLETGQPLHVFDLEKIAGKKITVRLARKGERIVALDGNSYKLDESMLVIADNAEALAIAGIKGGTKAEVGADTKFVLIEAACFDGPSIRKTSQTIKLRTDAAVRFSVGMDPNLAGDALGRATSLMANLSGGIVLKGTLDIYPKRRLSKKIVLRTEQVRALLGVELTQDAMAGILNRLGFEIKKKGKDLMVTVPTKRVDIELEEDLVEEIGRIYGYEKIQPKHPLGELIPPHADEEHFWEEGAKDIFAGLGFREAYNYSFIGEKEIGFAGEAKGDYWELENPSRPELAFLRRSLVPGFLRNAYENLKYADTVRMFELGHVYEKGNKKTLVREYKKLGGFLADRVPAKQAEGFFELKGALSSFFEKLGLEAWFDDIPAPRSHMFHPFRAALIKSGGEEFGIMGEIHPSILENAGIKGSMAAFEIDFTHLAKYADKEKEFRPISKYPSMIRDLALLTPLETRVEEVLDVIENTAGKLLVDTDLFDIYEGEELPEGKKNLAFHLVFQSPERTLTDSEVDHIIGQVTKALEENLEWEVRK